jgi:clan AA aspartic protease
MIRLVREHTEPQYQTFKSWADMGRVYAEIEVIATEDLMSARRGTLEKDQIRRTTVKFLVDTGADYLIINEHVKNQLNLDVLEVRTFSLADHTEVALEVVGPVDLHFRNRECTCRAVVLPGNAEPLLGVIPMEEMDIVIHPKTNTLDVNPESPLVAKHNLKKTLRP